MVNLKQTISRFPWPALLLFVIWWVILQTFAVISFDRFRLTEPDMAYIWARLQATTLSINWRGFIDLHARWDSGFYVWIAMDGYHDATAAFLPVYPTLIKFGTLAWSTLRHFQPDVNNFMRVAFFVSNLSALGATIALYMLARLDLSEVEAQRSLFYFLIFPTAFFLTANYSESVFVLLAILSFYAARRRWWLMASGFGILAILTRMTGAFLFVALLVEWWTSNSEGQRRNWRGLGLLLIPLAFVMQELYLNSLGFSFFTTQQQFFHRSPINPTALLTNLDWPHIKAHPAAQVNFAMDAGIGLFVVVVSILTAWRLRLSYGVFGILCIVVPLITGMTISLNRYGLVAFPIFFTLARYGHISWLDRAYTLVAILLLAMTTTLFVQGYWAG